MQERRLAAIMFTDIVGYTALMGSDEDRAFEVLRKNREIHSNQLSHFNGTLIKEMGDGILISFNLASDAVRCAIEIQKACKNQDIPLKIGIHEGEMVFEGRDVLGDGVNIASRIQDSAREGCIMISGSVYRDIKNKTGIKTEFVEEKQFKNVDETIKVYKVICDLEESIIRKEQKVIVNNKLLKYIMGGLLLLITTITLVWFFNPQKPSIEEQSELDKSIAVIPFVNLSKDPEQEFFSDGMVDEILDHLFKVGDLKVISRTSSMRFKNTELSIKEIAQELGVSAILEGSVRKIGNEVRITVQLIDAKIDTHLWSETYEGDLSDVWSIQTEVAQNVARELKATLTSKETELIQNKPGTTNSMAYEFYLRGNDYWSRLEAVLALEMYSKAITEDSTFIPAYARRASMHSHFCWLKIKGWSGHELLAKNDIEKGFQLDPESIEVKFAEAVYYYMIDRDYERSIKILQELKEYAPNMAELYVYSAHNLRRQGNLDKSINELKRGILLDPFNANYIHNLSGTYNLQHQYDKSIENSRHGLSLIPDYKRFNRQIFWAFLFKNGDLEIALKESEINEEDFQYEILYFTQQYDKLIEFINKEFILVSNQSNYRPKTYQLAFIHYLSGNPSQSRVYADSAIALLKDKIRETPEDDRLYATLGKCYAFSGNMKQAHFNGKKSVDLLPIKRDVFQGPNRERDLLEIYTITGNYDLALDKIEYLLSIPSSLSKGILMIDPIYNKLRNLPRFKEIIKSDKAL